MHNILLKYNFLDPVSKKQAGNYIDNTLARMKNIKKKQSPYKKRILSVSIWSNKEIGHLGLLDSLKFEE